MSAGTASRLDGVAAAAVQAIPWLFMVLLLGLGAWRVADWFWRLAPPVPVARGLERVDDRAQAIVARHWFGVAETRAAATATGSGKVTATGSGSDDIRLLGVIAGGRHPVAMLQVGKTTHEVLPGERFAGQYELREVGPEHVTIRQSGSATDRRIDLPTSPSAEKPGIVQLPEPAATAAGAAVAQRRPPNRSVTP